MILLTSKIIIGAVLVFLVLSIIVALNFSAFHNWLVYAVSEAEKRFGGKTGKLKLRYVYDLAVEAFPVITKVIPFSFFCFAVDSALVIMRGMIDDNKAISDIIHSEEKKE